MLTEQMQEKVLIFNTYFMSKLAPNEQIDSINSSEPAVMQPMFEKNYQTVRRVTHTFFVFARKKEEKGYI